MTSAPVRNPDVQPEDWRKGLSDYQVVNALMKRMGSK